MFITVIVLLSCSSENDEREVGEEQVGLVTLDEKLIVAVGDSLTAGYNLDLRDSYPYFLEQKLKERGYDFRVVNAGISAETSSGTLSRIQWILTMKPEIVILETGANDGLRGIDPQLTEDNLREILRILDQENVTVLLAGMQMVWNLGPPFVKRFNAIYPRLAKEFGLVFMPFFLKDVAMQNHLNQRDGIHPNREGNMVIAENILPYVEETIAVHQADES
jgi:acyl-CoA thioesterase-1